MRRNPAIRNLHPASTSSSVTQPNVDSFQIRTRPLLFQRYLRSRSVRLLYRLRPHPGVNRPPHDVITPQNPPADSLQHLVLQPEASSKTAQNGRIKESSPLLLLLLLNSRSLLSPSLTSPLIQAQP
ncbi:hypothetical protein BFJ70_g13464 [Fusarium oxysporum]|nr:hypothetical protein BFJ70_g13464 [Fusarium oxysporum]